MQSSEYAVKYNPYQCNQNYTIVVRNDDPGFSCFDIVLRELLLAARALVEGREESENHLKHKYRPYYEKDSGTLFQSVHNHFIVLQPKPDVLDDEKDKQNGSVKQPEIMKHAYRCDFSFLHETPSL